MRTENIREVLYKQPLHSKPSKKKNTYPLINIIASMDNNKFTLSKVPETHGHV